MRSEPLSWYRGPTVLEGLSAFQKEAATIRAAPSFSDSRRVQFHVRRILTGRITSGRLSSRRGDLFFLRPTRRPTFKSIEAFNVAPLGRRRMPDNRSVITLDEQIFVERGEMASHQETLPLVSSVFRVNLFWLGKRPLGTRPEVWYPPDDP